MKLQVSVQIVLTDGPQISSVARNKLYESLMDYRDPSAHLRIALLALEQFITKSQRERNTRVDIDLEHVEELLPDGVRRVFVI